MYTLTRTDPAHPEALAILSDLSASLAAITGSSGNASFDAQDVRVERACFILARDADNGVQGCGALRPLTPDIAEIKRMYAAPGSRGLGRALLRELEDCACALGYRAVWLETRRVNIRAVAFYLKHGYQPIANYGGYIGNSEAVCFGKELPC